MEIRFSGVCSIYIRGTGGAHPEETVNDHSRFSERGLLAISATPVVMVAEYMVFVANSTEGEKTATLVATRYVTVPGTFTPPDPVTVKVEELIETGSMDVLNTAEMFVMVGQRRIAPLDGATLSTVGGGRSEGEFTANAGMLQPVHIAIKMTNATEQ